MHGLKTACAILLRFRCMNRIQILSHSLANRPRSNDYINFLPPTDPIAVNKIRLDVYQVANVSAFNFEPPGQSSDENQFRTHQSRDDHVRIMSMRRIEDVNKNFFPMEDASERTIFSRGSAVRFQQVQI